MCLRVSVLRCAWFCFSWVHVCGWSCWLKLWFIRQFDIRGRPNLRPPHDCTFYIPLAQLLILFSSISAWLSPKRGLELRCMSLLTLAFASFPWALTVFYLLWRNIYSNTLFVLKLNCSALTESYEFAVVWGRLHCQIMIWRCSSPSVNFHFPDNVPWSSNIFTLLMFIFSFITCFWSHL